VYVTIGENAQLFSLLKVTVGVLENCIASSPDLWGIFQPYAHLRQVINKEISVYSPLREGKDLRAILDLVFRQNIARKSKLFAPVSYKNVQVSFFDLL
jgi:hypothetical protein